VLEVLDSLGVRPDLIVGTSMGAVVGALYASGYRATEIDSIIRAAHLATLFQRYTPRRPQGVAGSEPLVTWSRATGGITLAANPVQGAELNATVAGLMLRGNLLARGDFDRLPIPFRAVATRLNDGRGVVFLTGDLGRAVRASMSVPIVFDPVVIAGDRLVDGGLFANVPVEPARAAGAARVIVSDASQGLADTLALATSAPAVRVIGHLVSLLSSQPPDSLGPEDAVVRMTLARYGLLDFSDATMSALIAEGRRAATASLSTARCLPRAPTAEPAPRLPTTIGSVYVEAKEARVARDLTTALHLTPGARLNPAQLRADLLAFPVLSRETAVWLSPTGVGDTVDFRVVIERPHELIVGLGLAYDYDQGGRFWVGTGGRPPAAGGVIAWSLLSLDRFEQSVAIGANHSTLWRRGLMSLGLTLRAANERVRVFGANGLEGGPLRTRELKGFAGLEPQLSARWEGALGLEARTWSEPGRTSSGVGGLVRLQQVDAAGTPLVQTEANLTGAYQRVSAVGELHGARLARGHLEVIPFGRYGWGKRLPLQATFPLGGAEGFPGLALGERRGSREVLAGLRVQYALGGGLFAEANGQGGATDGEGDAISNARWLMGARVGLGADTPVGSLRVAYGRNSLGRGAVFVRVGSWW
jgi:predicted acylesterase/phospholipase RssA